MHPRSGESGSSYQLTASQTAQRRSCGPL